MNIDRRGFLGRVAAVLGACLAAVRRARPTPAVAAGPWAHLPGLPAAPPPGFDFVDLGDGRTAMVPDWMSD